MKTFLTFAALAAASQMPGANAWWDNGHMLVGAVATQLMSAADVTTIHKVLAKWNEPFPNTDSITTTAIWPDLVKCTATSSFCNNTVTPSFVSMGDWHYVDLPLDINGGKYGGLSDDDVTLFNYNIGGSVIDQLEASIKLFTTTQSTWAANLIIRNLIHFFGDLHQPLHAVGGLNATEKNLPAVGDGGGNSFKFQAPCAHSNLHALWDAAGGLYSLNNWTPFPSVTPDAAVATNATALIGLLPLIDDSVSFDGYKSLSYADFYKAVVTTDKAFRKVALESRKIAAAVVYKGIDLKFVTSTTVACPTQAYQDNAAQYAQFRIALGGKRLAVVLSQIAGQLRVKKLDT